MDFGQRSALTAIDRELFRYAKTHLVYLRFLIEGTTFLRSYHGVGWPVVTLGAKSPTGHRFDLVVSEKAEDGTLTPKLYIDLHHQLGPTPKAMGKILEAQQAAGVPVLEIMLGFAGVEYAYGTGFWLDDGVRPIETLATPQVIQALKDIELSAGKEFKQTLTKYLLYLRQQWARLTTYHETVPGAKKGRQRIFFHSLYQRVLENVAMRDELRLVQDASTAAGKIVLYDTQSPSVVKIAGDPVHLYQVYVAGKLLLRADFTDVPAVALPAVRPILYKAAAMHKLPGGLTFSPRKPRETLRETLGEIRHLDHQTHAALPTFAEKEIRAGRGLLAALAKGN